MVDVDQLLLLFAHPIDLFFAATIAPLPLFLMSAAFPYVVFISMASITVVPASSCG
jgi:hypothetical protein